MIQKPIPYQELARLHKAGKSAEEMAAHFRITVDRLYHWNARARAKGYIPPLNRSIPYAKLAKFMAAGRTPSEIAEEMDAPKSTVYNWIFRARQQGHLPPSGPVSLYNSISNHGYREGVRIGSMRECVDGLPDEVAQWLIKEIPGGLSVADFIRSIVVDAYHEETANDQQEGPDFKKSA